jgi:hypothetical protein
MPREVAVEVGAVAVFSSVRRNRRRVVVMDKDGGLVAVEVSAVPLYHDEHIIGVFGQVLA